MIPTITTMLQQEKCKEKRACGIRFSKITKKVKKQKKKNNQKSKKSERKFKTKGFLLDIL